MAEHAHPENMQHIDGSRNLNSTLARGHRLLHPYHYNILLAEHSS